MKSDRAIPLGLLGAFVLSLGVPVLAQQQSAWTTVDHLLGRPGQSLAGDVHKYGWPRTDLHVTLGGVPVEPALALGSWAAFKETGRSGQFVVMGDLVLRGAEVNPVIRALQAGGIDVTAVHNHLIGESPRLLYLHYSGTGEAPALARTLRGALEKTATPLGPPAPAASASPAERAVLTKLQTALGRTGSMAGRVLQVSVPRANAVEHDGMEIPPAMGTGTGMNFEVVGQRVATTGDFVLAADEVNLVIKALEAHGIEVEALHSHMLQETPRTFFMHFWGVGTPDAIGAGLKAALAVVKTR
ncbi:MAG: DUF1259 domain-containing protein [Betaproteobacteria bacterium]